MHRDDVRPITAMDIAHAAALEADAHREAREIDRFYARGYSNTATRYKRGELDTRRLPKTLHEQAESNEFLRNILIRMQREGAL